MRTYVIVNVSDLPSIDFSEVLETNIDTLVRNLDNTKAMLKYDGSMPSTITALSEKEGPYTRDEVITAMETSGDWVE